MSRSIALDNLVFRCLVGSTLYGTGVDDQDDRDELGISIEPPTHVIGLDQFEHHIERTQPEGVRSGPGDLDLTIYSLRKWARLALVGNPSILVPLFVPDNAVMVSRLDVRVLRGLLVARSCGKPFLGYMTQQRERLLGTRGGRHTNRPELIERYGFDTKYAYHMVRLGLQGVELLETGSITIPVPEPHRTWLRDLRQGGHTKDEAVDVAVGLEQRLVGLLTSSDLPERPNRQVLNNFLIGAYEAHWQETQR